MSGLINELVVLLTEQAENFENLLALSLEKKDVIVENDVETLQKITNIENSIIGNNQRLEKKRVVLIKDIANVLNKDANELSLAVLQGLIVNQSEHPQLVEVSKRIHTAVEALGIANEQNGILINNALDYIDFSINVIRGSVASETPYYSSNGGEVQNGNVFFDAKQ